jgi:alkanesulfonate monooxygenase SsuD/methylene tetrahydromethanopterin reductase-like flavin-dependent oxidoreductase (luciferase family)
MKISYFETDCYIPPSDMPREWPVRSGSCDPDTVSHALRGMAERGRFVEKLGFDWISLSEHHYLPHILTPSPAVSAAWLVGQVDRIKIALLGPIVPTSNPIRVA